MPGPVKCRVEARYSGRGSQYQEPQVAHGHVGVPPPGRTSLGTHRHPDPERSTRHVLTPTVSQAYFAILLLYEACGFCYVLYCIVLLDILYKHCNKKK